MGWVGIGINARIEIEQERGAYKENSREEIEATFERVEIYVEGERQSRERQRRKTEDQAREREMSRATGERAQTELRKSELAR